jgi:hypothetical protein
MDVGGNGLTNWAMVSPFLRKASDRGKRGGYWYSFSCILLVFGLLIVLASCFNEVKAQAEDSSTLNAPSFEGIAKYYDDRQCAVTVSLDDFKFNCSAWQSCLSSLSQKGIYHTIGIITNSSDWNCLQYWVNRGFTEAASHSRNHVTPPYVGYEGSVPKISYDWQINGSKQDILGNLTLPCFWRYGNRQYVYAWIEPFGRRDDVVRESLGASGYLCDRTVSGSFIPYCGLPNWDQTHGLFYPSGFTADIGILQNGGVPISYTNSLFDEIHTQGGVYHLMSHPLGVNWTTGGYADQHLNYISNRTDVWYVPLGLLFLYHWMVDQNITQVTPVDGQHQVFNISISHSNHEAYGAAYPLTYVFSVPINWTKGYAYYNYNHSDSWVPIGEPNSFGCYNGATAARFNSSEHKMYVSVPFGNTSDSIHVRILPTPLPRINWSSASLAVERGRTEATSWSINIQNLGNDHIHAVSISPVNNGSLKIMPAANPSQNISSHGSSNASFSVLSSSASKVSSENVTFRVDYVDSAGTRLSETWSTPVTVTRLSTTMDLHAVPRAVARNGTTTVRATLLDGNMNPVPSEQVCFYLGSTLLGFAYTDSEGNASLPYKPDVPPGTHFVTALFNGSQSCSSAQSEAKLEVTKIGTSLKLSGPFEINGATATLSATLTDKNGRAIGGMAAEFQVCQYGNWSSIGNAKTDTAGNAFVAYSPHLGRTYPVRVLFGGTADYVESVSETNYLEINPRADWLFMVMLVVVAFLAGTFICAGKVRNWVKRTENG